MNAEEAQRRVDRAYLVRALALLVACAGCAQVPDGPEPWSNDWFAYVDGRIQRSGMLDRVLADVVLLLHLTFIVFVMAGGLLALRWRWAPLAHLPAVCWGAHIELSGGICPLTPLENTLRRSAGSSGYEGGFVEHYLVPLIYPAGLTHDVQLLLAGAVIGVNALVYATVWRRRRWRARSRFWHAPRHDA